ncbi:M20 family metallopeptidase [Candidatus Gracilibacteria bacterium]|nr:M20 family metallopeptidase [Candidatus Gracilibacteria bacterium]
MFTTQIPSMLASMRALVEHETPSLDKARLDRCCDHLITRFQLPDVVIDRFANDGGGDHLRIGFAPAGTPELPPTLLLCHYDTVFPAGTLAARPFRVEGDHAYGPGIYDMKASIVLAEFVLRAFIAQPAPLPRPLCLLITSDEEIGSRSSRLLIEDAARTAAQVLVLEPPIEPHAALKTARKGVGRFVVDITGRAAHAGVEPHKGASAIVEMAQQILAIQALNDDDTGTTLNIGLANGGTRANVVPDRATLTIDARTWTVAEAERITKAMLALRPQLAGTALRVTGSFDRPPMERGTATAALFARAQAIGATLGMQLNEGSTGGGSDGNFTAALGVATLDGLGVPGAGAHAEHEHIFVAGLAERAALLYALLRAL